MPIRTDPVCGAHVDESAAGVRALLSKHEGKTYYFCSMACKREFDLNRHAYIPSVDVICGRELDPDETEAQARYSLHEGHRYGFCSEECKAKFDLAPGFYSRLHHAQSERPPESDRPAE